MAKKKRTIINPNAISKAEQEFIEKGTANKPESKPKKPRKEPEYKPIPEKFKSKSRNISATDEQWDIIDSYLNNLSKWKREKRSTFIMRVVLEYIEEQNNKEN